MAVVAAILLYAALPERYTIGPFWLLPALETAVLLGLSITAPRRHPDEVVFFRVVTMSLIGLVTVANFFAIWQLIDELLHGSKLAGGPLIFASVQMWLTNVLVFGLWYWELDRGGPGQRRRGKRHPDFLFPQMSQPSIAVEGWLPGFVDYLYLSFTNALAFSPTDTMPLSRWAKLLMLAQSLASVAVVVFVAARAVNILS